MSNKISELLIALSYLAYFPFLKVKLISHEFTMYSACGTIGGVARGFWWANLSERDPLEDNIKYDLQESRHLLD
jgi:hypothetical protein